MAEHEKAVEIPSEPSSTESHVKVSPEGSVDTSTQHTVHDPAENYRVDVDTDPDAKTDHQEDDDPEQHAGEFSDEENNS